MTADQLEALRRRLDDYRRREEDRAIRVVLAKTDDRGHLLPRPPWYRRLVCESINIHKERELDHLGFEYQAPHSDTRYSYRYSRCDRCGERWERIYSSS